jgi:hypothetical protein
MRGMTNLPEAAGSSEFCGMPCMPYVLSYGIEHFLEWFYFHFSSIPYFCDLLVSFGLGRPRQEEKRDDISKVIGQLSP